MTHTACGGTIEIRTDPKNTAYVVTSGARARDTGSDVVVAERSGALLIGDEAERERARQDAFRAFEVGIEDREEAVVAKERVEELWEASKVGWERHDDTNAILRKAFRVGRDERKRQAERDGGLAEKMSFGFELVGEVESDVRRARMVEFGGVGSSGGVVDDVTAEERMAGRPLFDKPANAVAVVEKKAPTPDGKHSKTNTATKTGLRAAALHTTLIAATRARLDAFGTTPAHGTTSPASASRKHKDSVAIISGIKRKRHSPAPSSATRRPGPSSKTIPRPPELGESAPDHVENVGNAPATMPTAASSNGRHTHDQDRDLLGDAEQELDMESSSSIDKKALLSALPTEHILETTAPNSTIGAGARAGAGASLVDYASDVSDE